jgi:hypothetical protein
MQAAVGCTFSISPSSQSAQAGATSGSTTVTTQNGCPWVAQSNVNWITLTSGAGGSGGGLVTFSIAANGQASQRVGTLTIATQTYTVTQSGGTCTVSLSPTSASVSGAGGSGSTNVTAPAGCAWSADDRRADVHHQPGCHLLLYGVAPQPDGGCRRGIGHDYRNGRIRVCLDGGEPRRMDHGDRRFCQNFRRNSHLHGGRQFELARANRHDLDCGPKLPGDA